MGNPIHETIFGPMGPLRPVLSATTGMGDLADYLKVVRREIYLFGEIEEEDDQEENVGYVIRGLRLLDAISHEPITLRINSPGGDILSGLALIQTMLDLDSPVHTFVVGQAASMAAVVAVAGTKRLAYPGARWLLHRGKGGAEGDYEDIAISARELLTVDTYADQIILNRTHVPSSKLSKMQRKDYWLGVSEALKWGLVDEVVAPKNGPADWKDWLPDPKRLQAKLSRLEVGESRDEKDEEKP